MTILRVLVLLACVFASDPSWARDRSGSESSATKGPAPVTVTARQEQPKRQEEFVPISELPPQQQLPAAPLLISAYAFVLLMLFGYILSVSRRLSGIQREVDQLEADLKHNGGS